MILRPQQEAGKARLGKNRMIVLAKKKLPEVKAHGHYWAFVELVSDDISVSTE